MKTDFSSNTISVLNNEWKPAVIGERGEYLLQLDDGVFEDPEGTLVNFDYITDETYGHIENTKDTSAYVTLVDYLTATGRSPPEKAFYLNYIGTSAMSPKEKVMPEFSEPKDIRREITDKLMKTMYMHFHVWGNRRTSTTEEILNTHTTGQRVFWEVYSGDGLLSKTFERNGWEVRSFDLTNGWDFEKASNRRAFLELQDKECPDFIWYAPPCKKWSTLQNLNLHTLAQIEALEAERDFQEATHLRLCSRSFMKQKREGRHAGLEQPRYAVSWKTKTLKSLEDDGFDSLLDQCQFGTMLPDSYGDWMYIKKPTQLRWSSFEAAEEMTRLCVGNHEHLPIEGSSPKIGNRARASGAYQQGLCNAIYDTVCRIYENEFVEEAYANDDAEATEEEFPLENNTNDDAEQGEEEQTSPEGDPVLNPDEADPRKAPQGALGRLRGTSAQDVKRTIMRLHRNLGHPTSGELMKLLERQGASAEMIQGAKEHQCNTCDLHKRPIGHPVSSVPRPTHFNDRVQADTLWVHVPGRRKATPVLMMSDATTRLLSGRELRTESTEEFIKQMERGWVRSFGPMKRLFVDEHRAWCSDGMRQWCTEQGVELKISPGESHTRLAILERRHQVVRRALTAFLTDNPAIAQTPEAMITALCYVIPQVNRMPNVSGYSPVQWAMGYTPHIPGLLMEEQITPIHLDPTEAFKEKLELQASAAKAITEANIDARLRRALLRKFVGQPLVLNSGDRCYYWRDGPANGPKLRWRGPAVVVMKETSEAGPHADIYWLAHGTTLLRAAPEHVRPAMHPENDESRAMDSIDRAKLALMKVRNRGVTHYIDLPKSNKRKREEVASEDEAEELDHEMGDFEAEPLQDRWQASDDGRTWTRIHNQGRQQLFVPDLLYDEVPFHLFTNERVTHIRRGGPNPETLVVRDEWNGPDADRRMHYSWTGTTTFVVDAGLQTSDSDGEMRQLFSGGGPTSGGAGGPDDDPTAPFRGPPSVSPSPSIADDEDMRGADGGGPSDNAATQAILAEPMDDGQDQRTLLPTPAGSVMEPMEEPPGQQATPHGRLPPPALLPEDQPLPAQPQQAP